MTKLEQVEQLIASLGKDDLKRLARWWEEFQADEWDRQMQADAKAGKLDKLIGEARSSIAKGNVRDL
ncbi:MAG: hypothetical protein KGO53_00370 [Alphaproteobacteria bacterium]|nr:hypothetical protein [Alphaproteobacteria bacterium]